MFFFKQDYPIISSSGQDYPIISSSGQDYSHYLFIRAGLPQYLFIRAGLPHYLLIRAGLPHYLFISCSKPVSYLLYKSTTFVPLHQITMRLRYTPFWCKSLVKMFYWPFPKPIFFSSPMFCSMLSLFIYY